ncbi:MAG TPA: phosphatase PAP2 family protein [Acidimicrobiales bacterium]|nr:phosphatase PAP2 family protein [Acidimicrobiales bacterium]
MKAPLRRLGTGPLPRAGAVGAGAFGLAALVAASTVVTGEVALTEAANDLPGPVVDALDVVMQLGTRAAIPLVAIVAAVLADRRRLRVALAVVLAGLAAWWAASVAKEVVERPRPSALGAEVEVRDQFSGPGFPSSHVSVAAGALVAAALALRRPVAVAAGVAGAVGLGRMAVGVHLPLDVVGGLGLGATAAALAVFLALR